jgi:hypothetical protein
MRLRELQVEAMRTERRHQGQLSLEELVPVKPEWEEFPAKVRAEAIELLRQILVGHVEGDEEARDE